LKKNAKTSMKEGENRKIRKWGFFVNSGPRQPEGYERGGCFALAHFMGVKLTLGCDWSLFKS
jgi:hypothetical protein